MPAAAPTLAERASVVDPDLSTREDPDSVAVGRGMRLPSIAFLRASREQQPD
jgi:hypothetical protein